MIKTGGDNLLPPVFTVEKCDEKKWTKKKNYGIKIILL